ncbi:Uncharacterised protein [Streptococcus pneumoniae]|nr:Uncharacterised protein [Streptococcus pneumoniae]
MTKASRCKVGCRIVKLIQYFHIKDCFIRFKVCDGLAQMLSDVLPTNICQLMDWSVDDISKTCEHQEVLGCLGRLNKNQTVIITLANFFQGGSRKGTWTGTLDVTCLGHADVGIFLSDKTSCINLNCFRSVF